MNSPVHRRTRLAMLGVSLAVGGPVLAYGPTGHLLAGRVAEPLLCAPARAEVRRLLGDEDLGKAGLWADDQRDRPPWTASRPWHYLNVPPGTSVARAARAVGDQQVLAALARFERELADTRRTRGERADALRFAVHFITDIHQPLHIGRAADRGGNTVDVRWQGDETSLHAFWDGEPLWRPRPGARRPALKVLLRGLPTPTARELRAWQRAEPREWATESLELHPQVYAGVPGTVDEPYRLQARRITERRLVQAGVRMAGRLNRLLGCRAENG